MCGVYPFVWSICVRCLSSRALDCVLLVGADYSMLGMVVRLCSFDRLVGANGVCLGRKTLLQLDIGTIQKKGHFVQSLVLASWFRLKYPHMAIGALASSTPILYFDDITPQDAYYSIVSRDF
ncbi:hypothetical protein VNO80_10745 [Phaseolus coccineus]|uniref:Uncharacterized protein n=1 Tax=Phaseolus coccineus TaxID=3886 RepID=A0AAN9N987_PHACN